MTPHEKREEQKARIRGMYSNANDVIEKASPKDTDTTNVNTNTGTGNSQEAPKSEEGK